MRCLPAKLGDSVEGGRLGGGKLPHSFPGVAQGGTSLNTKKAWMQKQIYLNLCVLGLNVNILDDSFIHYKLSMDGSDGTDGIGGVCTS